MRKCISGWAVADFATYKSAYLRLGGSVCSHPDVIDFLGARGTPPAYYVYSTHGEVTSATFVSGKQIRVPPGGYPFVFDDIIIPHKKRGKRIFLPFGTKHLSPYHQGDFYNGIYWTGLKRRTCIVKDAFSPSTHKKRRQALNTFIRQGGECRSVDDFSNDALCDIYISLFKKRWGDTLSCYSRDALSDVLGALRHLVFGYVLLMNGQPCAYDLVFKAECPQWIFFDCINGGVDPDFASLSVGSVLMYMNIQRAKALCVEKKIKMAFSLGMDNPRWAYKKQWCNTFVLGRTLTV
jgi:hypothetical protein